MIATSPDGVPIAYDAWGTGAPLVLLHGFTDTGRSWCEAGYVDRFLRAGRQVMPIDCRGHGASGKPHDPEAYAGDRRARDVIAVLDALDIERADLVGYSMGGTIALATALRFAERVRALVVIGAHPFAQDMAPYRQALADGLQRWVAMVEAQGVRLSDDARRRLLGNDVDALRACVARDRPDVSPALATLKAPLLAVAGTQDPLHGAVRTFAERVGGRFLPLEGRTHVTAFLAADEIAQAIEDLVGDRTAEPASFAPTAPQ